MCGAPGSGKSHIAKKLYGHLPILDPDNFIDGEWSREKANDAWDIIHDKIANYTSINLEFVVDSSQRHMVSRRYLTQYIRQVAPSYEVICVCVKTSLPTCHKRNMERDRMIPEKVLDGYWTDIYEYGPTRNDGFDWVVVVDGEDYKGNKSETWTTKERWPEGWYRA